ncbi:MAG: galactose oxidase-like domain-containing protein [Pseudonocardia sp.]
MVVLTTTLAVSGIGATSTPLTLVAEAGPDAATKGSWSAPFEEGGSETPRCEYIPNDSPNDSRERLQCKPTAVTTALLPDGRYLYASGIESEENAEEGAANSLSPESRDSPSRVLDLRDGTPSWYTPETETGGSTNDVIVEGRTSDDCLTEHPQGVAGVPGRPGDGFVGNLAGQLGIPAAEPTCAPDDVPENDTDLFCGDIAQMADGRHMIIGGTDWYNEPSVLEKADGDPVNIGVVELEGLRQARIFDWRADGGKGDWSDGGDMKYGRWYPANLTGPDGKQYAYGGTTKLVKSTQGSQVTRVESFDPANETPTWDEEYSGPSGDKTLPQNPRIFVAPDGRHFYNGDGQMWGPFGQSVDEVLFGQQGFFDPETDSWENGEITIPRSSPAASMLPMSAPYDEIKILSVGGTFGPDPGTYLAQKNSDFTTVKLDGTVINEPGPTPVHARWFGNAVPLPTGQILITHGAMNDEVIIPGLEIPVPQPELYDPETNTFTEMATPERIRTYHNSATLLPNGQVVVGGNSPISLSYGHQRDLAIPPFDANNDKDSSFELFDPPYLHNGGERPVIDYAPEKIEWDQDFKISSPDVDKIERITLMRLPAIQHVYDNDPRTLILDFKKVDDDSVHASLPGRNVAIPGYYMLFINTQSGEDKPGLSDLTPSQARIIKVGDGASDQEAPQPFDSTEFASNGASPVENNTYLNNPPNPLEKPTVPGETDPMGLPVGGPALPEAVTSVAPGTSQGRRGAKH